MKSIKPELLELSKEMMKMPDEEFARALVKTPTDKLALLGEVESLVLRAQKLLEDEPKLMERVREEVKTESEKANT